MSRVLTGGGPITVRYADDGQPVADTGEPFAAAVREIAAGCRQDPADPAWRQDFDRFLARLNEWGHAHADIADAVAVLVGDGQIHVLVRNLTDGYNPAIEDVLTDFDLDLTDEFPWLAGVVLQRSRGFGRDDRTVPDGTIFAHGHGN